VNVVPMSAPSQGLSPSGEQNHHLRGCSVIRGHLSDQTGAPAYVTVNITDLAGNLSQHSYEHVNGAASGTEVDLGVTSANHC